MQQNYLLELDGKAAGRFFALTGGGIEAGVVSVRSQPGNIEQKHISSIRYQDMVLTCGTGMSHAFYDWVGTSFGGGYARQTGAVVALDHKQSPIGRLEFWNALVKSLVLPELDRTANKDAYMTVSISPEMTRSTKREASAKLGVYVSSSAKSWNISSFRLRIDGLENDCAKVTKIGSLNLGKKLKDEIFGERRYASKEPTKTEYPNIVVTLPNIYADGFYKWFDEFVVKGNNFSSSEKKGTLEFFAPSSTKAYFGLEFSGLGIFSFSDGLRSKSNLPVTVGMYCESMKFYAGASAII